eukprot:sb/3477638/
MPLNMKQPIRTRYLGQVPGCQPIRDQYFLIRSVVIDGTIKVRENSPDFDETCAQILNLGFLGFLGFSAFMGKQSIRLRYLGHVTGCQPIRDQDFLIRSQLQWKYWT